jgi:outer membrane biogenesis lipoprotein LolB
MTSVTTRRAFIGTLTSTIVAFLMVACSTVRNTPAQDEAWSRWTACRSQVPGVEIRNVQLDGRISFWANGVIQGRSMLDCLARAGTNGPALPDAIYANWPSGP